MTVSVIQTGNAKYISRLNKTKVLNLIRNRSVITRAEIAKKSGLSAPTVSRIVESLIEENLVIEMGRGVSLGGKRPTLLKFLGEKSLIIGIDLGTTNIQGILADLNADIVAEVTRPTKAGEGCSAVIKRTSEIIEKLKVHPSSNGRQILGIGMAVAGLINRKRNIVEFSPNFHWNKIDILEELSPKNEIPIIFDNVTRVMALGELWYGIGKEYKNLIVINVGYGIGAGIISDGKPMYGPLGLAGEFGHFTLEKESKIQCDCGNYGCLEALSSGNAIAKAAQKELNAGAKSVLMDMCEGDVSRVSAEMVAEAAKKGDAVAWDIFNRSVEYLGLGIAGLINLFSPEAVVIGGGVAKAGDILFDKVRKVVNARSLKRISEGVVIRPATFDNKAAVMGALSLILEGVLNLDYKYFANA